MKIIRSIKQLKKTIKKIESSIGFVPTMGALHKGHLSLIKKARAENDILVVSVFVNPTQFLAGEDLEKYPKKEIADIEICKRAGVDILFMPTVDMMYKDDEPHIQAPKRMGYILEGIKRAGHFNGMLTVVLKLFNLIKPTNAYFGKKDTQQLILIQDMVKRFFLDINIIPCETVREKSGLAMSSRNIYLSNKEKKEAEKISKALFSAINLINNSKINSNKLKEKIANILKPLKISYIEITDRKLKPIKTIKKDKTIILIAAQVGSTKLIDNIYI